MIYYRLYFLDASARIRRASELHCDGDAEAIDLAAGQHARESMELWSHARLVCRFPGVDP